MISLLLPTRKRLHALEEMMKSALENADNPNDIEFVCYIDVDDTSYNVFPLNITKVIYDLEDPMPLSDMWNACQKKAKGEIFMQCSDDIRFRTQHWDTIVKEAFDKYDDRIAFVFGNDGHPSRGDNHGTHGFVHKNWIDTVGYFLPPGYVADWSDQWLNDVARGINRHVYVDMLTEHLHPDLGKAERDETNVVANERRTSSRPDLLYASYTEEARRQIDIEKLKQRIEKHE